MKFVLKKFHRHIPDRQLIADVKAVAKKLRKKTVTRDNYTRYGKFHADTIQHRFRSWFTVLELAGLQPSRSPFNISTELLFKNLEEVWRRLGKQPGIAEMKDPKWQSRYSQTPYICRFGSWTKALEKFVAYKNRKGRTKGGKIEGKLKLPAKVCRTKNKKGKEYSRSVSGDLRFRVFLRDGFKCVICGQGPLSKKGIELHCDHIRPWSRGGRTIVRNLQTLCEACNLKKSSKMGAKRRG